MSTDDFRRLALELPDSSEQAHMNHPDFRVGGKIIATIAPDGECGMVKVSPDEQKLLIASEPDVYKPASGAWGRNGCTMVHLADADEASVRQALLAAWRNTAPKRLLQRHPERAGD